MDGEKEERQKKKQISIEAYEIGSWPFQLIRWPYCDVIVLDLLSALIIGVHCSRLSPLWLAAFGTMRNNPAGDVASLFRAMIRCPSRHSILPTMLSSSYSSMPNRNKPHRLPSNLWYPKQWPQQQRVGSRKKNLIRNKYELSLRAVWTKCPNANGYSFYFYLLLWQQQWDVCILYMVYGWAVLRIIQRTEKLTYFIHITYHTMFEDDIRIRGVQFAHRLHM